MIIPMRLYSHLFAIDFRSLFVLQVFCLFVVIQSAVGQEVDPKFHHYTSTEGLSQNNVTCILQDSEGFMWFGTQDGLNKYDGYTFTIYQNISGDTTTISNSQVTALLEDKDKNLWIATQSGGLNKYDRKNDQFTYFMHEEGNKNSLSSNKIKSLYQDKAGILWIGTDGEGLNRFDPVTKTFTHYKNDFHDITSIGFNIVSSLFEDSHGKFWVGTYYGGLNLMDREKGTFSHFPVDGGEKGTHSNKITQIFEDSKGNLWIAADNGGLSLYNRDENTFSTIMYNPYQPDGLTTNDVTALGEDPDGNIWIGTRNGGLNILDRKRNLHYFSFDPFNVRSLNNNSIYSIYKDNRGNMWVGTFAGGVNLHLALKENFRLFKPALNNINSLSHKEVLSIIEDKKGNIWIGTDGGGLNKYDPSSGNFTHFKRDDSKTGAISDNVIMTLVEDHKGAIWAGTLNMGVSILEAGSKGFKNYENDNFAKGGNHWNAPTSMIEDKDGKVWIGTWDRGLSFYDRERDTVFHYRFWADSKLNNKNINSNIIFSLHEDSEGFIWIGTQSSGLNMLDKKDWTITHFTHQVNNPASISGNNINAIMEDRNGNIWVGTNEGLNLFNKKNKTFKAFRTKEGLPNNVVQGILEDSKGNLWLSTNKGLSMFDPGTKVFKNYDVSDGLQGNEFKRNSAFRSKTGELYFGGTNGMNSFHPDSLQFNQEIPPVVLTNFKIFNQQVPIGEESVLKTHISQAKEITLPYHQSVFTFEFAALNYIYPDKNQYAYMLEGFDKEWNEVGNHRSATYTNLDPGKYTFRVKGSNNDNVWNEEGTALSVIITPPFWLTWWFKTLAALSVIGSAVTFYRVRVNAITQQKIRLEEQVKEKTANLVTANSELIKRQEEIATQRDHLKIANEQVMSSIQYAQTIQKAILPSVEKIAQVFPQHFILYRPKDVVSGDFYWFAQLAKEDTGLQTDLSFMAVVDCTGHGVPGAFMSIIGSTLLNEIVNQKQLTDPAAILEQLHLGVKQAVEKTEGMNTAGMDVCLIRYEQWGMGQVKIQFSGAKRNLLFVRNGSHEVEKLGADRRSIGSQVSIAFTTQELVLEKGTMLYLSSDGYTDQNNPEREKMGGAKFNEIILSTAKAPVEEQLQAFEHALDEHQQIAEQRDDISLLGIRV